MNAVIYARYSSDNQREESIEGQLRDCREYAEQNKLAIVGPGIVRQNGRPPGFSEDDPRQRKAVV